MANYKSSIVLAINVVRRSMILKPNTHLAVTVIYCVSVNVLKAVIITSVDVTRETLWNLYSTTEYRLLDV